MSTKTAPSVTATDLKKAAATPRRIPPSLLAWLVLLVAFGLFCLLAYTTISLVTGLLSNSVEYKEGRLQALGERDTNVFVLRRGQPKETLVSDSGEMVKEGDEMRTDKNSDAVLRLFDDTRIDLAPGSKVRLRELRIDVQNFRRTEKRVVLDVLDGSVKITVASPFVPSKDYSRALFKVGLPPEGERQAEVLLNDPQTGNYADGVYTMSVNRSAENGVRAWLNNKARKAVDVRGVDRTVSVGPGQRVALEQGRAANPGLPTDTQLELIANGSFINGIDSWRPQFDQGSDKGSIEGLIQFGAEKIDDGVQPRTRIVRLDPKADGNFAETSLVQEVNRDVSEYEDLWFSLKLRLVSQSLPGGGQQGFEYPIFVKVYYVDRANNQQEFFYGFYSRAADSRTFVQDQLNRSRKLPQDEWYEFRLNLMTDRNKPVRILKVVVGSAGHLYDSYFTDVSLVAS